MRRFISTTMLVVASLLASKGFALNPDVLISQYSHTAWRLQDGLLPSLPQAIQQTTDGYIWIGTLDGLLRFDGVRFLRWEPRKDQSLPSKQIVSLRADRDGGLWIGTSAGLAHLVSGNLIDFPEHRGAIEQIILDRAGRAWFTRAHLSRDDQAGPLCQVQGSHIRCYGVQDGIPFRYAQAIAEDAEGFLWIGTDVAVAKWRPGFFKGYYPAGLRSASGQHGVEALWADKDGSMWVGITRAGPDLGLQRIEGATWRPITLPGFDSRELKVWGIYKDSESSLWIGTTNRGLYRIREGRIDHFGASDGLSSDSPSTIFQDREGNLWVITSEGLDRFRALPVISFSMHEGLSAPLVRSVFAGKDGELWIANNDAINTFKYGVFSSIGKNRGLPGQIVHCVFQDHRGRVWAGVDDKFVVYARGTFTTLTLPYTKPVWGVHSITEDLNGDIWAVLDTGRVGDLLRIHDSKVMNQTALAKLPNVVSVSADPKGGVWLGLASGDLGLFKNGKLNLYEEPKDSEGNPNPIRDVVMDQAGSLLAITNEGLLRWQDGESKFLAAKNGLPCGYIGSFVLDQDRNVYLYMPCGIVAVSREEMQRWWGDPNTKIKFKLYDASDGTRFAKSYNTLSATRSNDGRLWFAGVDVLQMIDPSRLPFNNLPPNVVIEDIIVNGKAIDLGNIIRLPPNLRTIQFDYTALSFNSPHKVLFRYRLEGLDADWQIAGTRRQALYNDLRPGTYRFRVIASNNDGVWNEAGTSLNFTVAPTFYQRPAFKVLAVALALLAVWLLYLYRLSIATERVRVRYMERIVERERIARELHDTLLQGFQGLILRFQTATSRIPQAEPARLMMESALSRADEVLIEGRNRVRDLRAEPTSARSLIEVLKSFGDDLNIDNLVKFSTVVQGVPKMLRPSISEEAERVGMEAIANAFRHSHGTKIEVQVTFERRRLIVQVQDDGLGIEKHTLERGKPGHFGIDGMKERAARMRASLVLDSNRVEGTRVELSIPARIAYAEKRDLSLWSKLRSLLRLK